MKSKKVLLMVVFLAMALCMSALTNAAPMGTAFTYQGRLADANSPTEGEYDMEFKLFDQEGGSNQFGNTVTKDEVDVIDGYFTVQLDFVNDANVFDGDARWLQIGVREGKFEDPNVYVALSPRQEVTPAPYALYAGGDGDWTISGDDMYSAVSGNVGIGTASPGTKFHVHEPLSNDVYLSVEASSSDGEAGVRLKNPAGGWDVFANNDDADFGIAHAESDRVLTIKKTTGNVGIGTESPAAKLTINGAILRDGSTMWGSYADTHINLGTNSTTGTNGQDYSYATVGGGIGNTAGDNYATVGGGNDNTASEIYATVSGGGNNEANSYYTTVGGGQDNTASWTYATVAGGAYNTASGQWSTIGGGHTNTTSQSRATVCGGQINTASADSATIGGGYTNTASGNYATVPGGRRNTAYGDYSFAAGRRAKANHDGAFVWGDSTDADFTSTANDQFLIRASGGVGINTASPARSLHVNDVMRLEPRGSAPSSPSAGDIYFDSNDDKLKCYDGVTWKDCW